MSMQVDPYQFQYRNGGGDTEVPEGISIERASDSTSTRDPSEVVDACHQTEDKDKRVEEDEEREDDGPRVQHLVDSFIEELVDICSAGLDVRFDRVEIVGDLRCCHTRVFETDDAKKKRPEEDLQRQLAISDSLLKANNEWKRRPWR